MHDNDDVFYRAMLARDFRFDGKFFVAVKTTGIYCRPICRAPQPKRKNIEFFSNAILAENAGYRPCLRCRPECAPQSSAWAGKTAVVKRAIKVIAATQLSELRENEFAEQFGLSARHLRRLFTDELGQTPKQIYDISRLNFARRLVVDTQIAMTTIAATVGFRSLRRFNDAFKKRFARAPSQLRRRGIRPSDDGAIEIRLSYRPPFDWEALIDNIGSHSIAGVESIQGGAFERVVEVDGDVAWIQVHHQAKLAQVSLRIVTENPKILFQVVARVRRMFDLDSDPIVIEECFSRAKALLPLLKRYPGLRLPNGWDAFETAICTILGQLVSVEQARRLVGQVVENYGEEIEHPLRKEKVRVFPKPEALAKADLLLVKTTAVRRATIREFSQKVADGALDLSAAQDLAVLRKRLLDIKGVGPWSAEYICMRAIGDTDAFPGSDLILKRAVDLHPNLDLEKVRPWRAYAALYLWKGFARELSRKKSPKKGPKEKV